ncbi:pinensin family lanthipeptide, partial [Longimicrobium sp.]
MNKIKLTIEDLQVNSFATSETEHATGTVNAHGQQAFVTALPGCVPGCNT